MVLADAAVVSAFVGVGRMVLVARLRSGRERDDGKNTWPILLWK